MQIEASSLDKPVRFKWLQNPYARIFVIALFTALTFLLPYMILDKGLFLFYGDYCVQQVPFYSLAHDAIRSGNIWWNWNTDLGANFIGSYAFYLLGSPFFWLTIPLPSFIVPYCLGPLLALKMAVAAVTSYAYISRFVKKVEYAMLGGLLYAFSSYSIYNIFFNHFHEPMVFFPLLLLALEMFMKDDRKCFFAVAVFINALVNYNFFVGEVVFVVIYWIIRMFSGDWNISVKKYLLLAFEAVIGFCMSCVLIIPAVLAITGNPRTSSLLSGWSMLTYDWPQRYLDIIHSFFFPQDLPAEPNFFPDSNSKWTSMAAWLPLFSMTGVISYVIAKRGNWLRRIIMICSLCALVPVLNSAFVMFNTAYYCRWFYMLELMLALATAYAFESPDIDCMAGLKWTAGITAGFALAVGLIPKMSGNNIIQIGLENEPIKYWAYVALVAVGLAIVFILLKFFEKGSAHMAVYASLALVVMVCLYGNMFVSSGKAYGWEGNWFKKTAVEGYKNIKVDRSKYYRIDVLNGIDNQGMFWHLPTINAFQSVVPASIIEFYTSVGVTRDVASRPDTNFPGLRCLLSVRYVFDYSVSSTLSMPGYKYIGKQLGHNQWENTNYIPMGFTYTSYMTKQQFNLSANKDRVLLKALLLNPDQIKRYSGILDAYNPMLDSDFSDNALKSDCIQRRTYTCSSFKTDNKGFTSSIKLPSKNLVFFSVPYDSGWSATVNGKAARVEKVDNGLMAVSVPKGKSSIRFEYTTPGLYTGMAVTGISSVIFIAYVIFWYKRRRRRVTNRRNVELIELIDTNGGGIFAAQELENPGVPPQVGLPENQITHSGEIPSDGNDSDSNKESSNKSDNSF